MGRHRRLGPRSRPRHHRGRLPNARPRTPAVARGPRMTSRCPWCTRDCTGVDDTALRGENLDWLWQRLADIGDRRGDQDLITGTATITAPADATQRAAVTGLVGGRTPRPGQSIRVDLS